MAHCAYCSGQKMYSEYDGQWKIPHSDPARVQLMEVMLPPNAPREYADPETLWNAVDAAENSCVAQTARKMYIALPRELTKEQNIDLIHDYCQHEFVDKGMICNFFYHDSGTGNPHVHLMLTLRAMDEKGKWLPKTKTGFVLDENGNRIRGTDGKWKRYRADTVDWNDHKYGEIWRHDWETFQNAHLEKAGRPERVDMRSLARQGITDRLPGKHLGPAAAAMERKGIYTDVGDQNRRIQETNKELSILSRLHTTLKNWYQTLCNTIRDIKAVKEPDKDNLVDALIAYQNLREAERFTWSGYQQREAGIADLKEFAKVVSFLRENNLRTVSGLGKLLNDTGSRLHDLKSTVRRNADRIRDISALLEAVKAVAELTPVEDELKTKRFGRDKFIAAHKDDLSKLAKKRYLIDKLSKGAPIDEDALLAESQRLQSEIDSLNPAIEQTRNELDRLKKIRYMVRKVIPDALPSPKKNGKPLMSEQLEEEANKAELNRITDRVADHVLSQNPMKQESNLAEHHQDNDRKQE